MKLKWQIVVFDASDLAPDGPDAFRVYADPAGHPFCLCWVR